MATDELKSPVLPVAFPSNAATKEFRGSELSAKDSIKLFEPIELGSARPESRLNNQRH